jgi:phosphatidate phosphatase APP1
MITGYNTDVEWDGRTFHVQTEDKGRSNPTVESLVYSGGEILTTRRVSYADLAGSSEYSEEAVMRLMESQHQGLIREIRNGKFDPEGPKPFGYNIITNRSLDEVVMDFLSREVGVERIRLELENQQVFVEGTAPTVNLRVVADSSDRPVGGIRVTVKLISTRERPKELFAGSTNVEGRVVAKFQIPELAGANAAILCQAEAPGNSAEIKQLIRKAGDPT